MGDSTLQRTVVYLLRHGATPANVCRPHVLQGLRPDTELMDRGQEQARAAGLALCREPIVRVYSSPLKRALQTAKLVAQPCGAPVVLDDTLVEADVGDWTSLSWPEIERRWPEQHRAFHHDAERYGYLGGENLAQVRARALPAIERLAKLHTGETIAVVGHGVVNRVLLAHWIGIPLRFARQVPQDNAGISTFEFREGKVQVRTVNAVAHLGGMLPLAA
jgi:broad specificity phosphatase PhoE